MKRAKSTRLILVMALLLWGIGPAAAYGLNANPGQQGEQVGEISGTVWHDVNANGTIDAGESPLPGWAVTLYGEDETTVLASQATNAIGVYTFKEIKPNTPGAYYYVAETLGGPEWSNTTPTRIKVEVTYNDNQDVVFVTPIDKNFGNEKPSLGFHEDSGLLPYTGGADYLKPLAAGQVYTQKNNPPWQGYDGLLRTIILAMLGLMMIIVGGFKFTRSSSQIAAKR